MEKVSQVDLVSLKNSILSTAVTVTTSATALPASSLSNRKTIALRNNSSVTVYIGSSAVTSSSGFPLGKNDSIVMDVSDGVVVYGRTASSSANVRVLEIS